jgi:hypothetical protein
MQFNKSSGLFFAVCALLLSCRHEHVQPIQQYLNYSQLKVGNYWIYQRFQTDYNGVETPLNVYDSCYVEKDTVINDKVYFKVVRPYTWGTFNSFQRDTLHYVVNEKGQILFSSEDFSSVFRTWYQFNDPADTICRNEERMTDKNKITEVPAGTFTTSDYCITSTMYPRYSRGDNHRYQHHRYAENIGLVYETMEVYVGGPEHTERKLVRYKVN